MVRNFTAARGLALALSLTGGGIAVAVTPTLVVWLLTATNIRLTFAIIGCVGGLVMLAAAWRYFHDLAAPPPAADGIADAAPVRPGYALREVFKLPDFWKLVVVFTFVAVCAGTFTVHIQPMLMDSGLTPARAASVALFIGPAMIAGRLCTGALFDFFDPRIVAGAAFALPALAALMLLSLDGTYLMSAAAGVVVGLCLGAEIDVLSYLTSRYFGIRSYGRIFGVMTCCYSVGIGTGSVLAGWLFDVYQNYDVFLIALCAGSSIAVLLVAAMNKPRAW